MRAHLFFSMVSATFPARRHNSSAILLLCVHFTHLLCRPTSAAWHFRNAFRSQTLLLPCAFVHNTFLILRNLERIARLYERRSLAFAESAALAAASSALSLETSALRRAILRSARLRPRAIARTCAPSFFAVNFSNTSFFFHLFAFAFRYDATPLNFDLMCAIWAWHRFPSSKCPLRVATCTRHVATWRRRILMRLRSSFFDIFFSAASDTPSFFNMSSAPIHAASCFFEPANLAWQTDAFTRVAAAIFSQIMRPLFLSLYLFHVFRRRA